MSYAIGSMYVVLYLRAEAGMATIKSDAYSNQPWLRGSLRKPAECKRCRSSLAKGASAYRPIDNGMNRMDRLCVPCVENRAPQL